MPMVSPTRNGLVLPLAFYTRRGAWCPGRFCPCGAPTDGRGRARSTLLGLDPKRFEAKTGKGLCCYGRCENPIGWTAALGHR